MAVCEASGLMSGVSQGSVNVNMDSAPVVADMNKKHLYPNYLSFTLCMASLCWLCNITTYICIIPAIICSAVVRLDVTPANQDVWRLSFRSWLCKNRNLSP